MLTIQDMIALCMIWQYRLKTAAIAKSPKRFLVTSTRRLSENKHFLSSRGFWEKYAQPYR